MSSRPFIPSKDMVEGDKGLETSDPRGECNLIGPSLLLLGSEVDVFRCALFPRLSREVAATLNTTTTSTQSTYTLSSCIPLF
jgi:hypothetical protein